MMGRLPGPSEAFWPLGPWGPPAIICEGKVNLLVAPVLLLG